MKLLESDWFYRMVESQGKTPQDKLLAVYTVIGQWMTAPGIKEMLAGDPAPLPTLQLKTYLTNTALAARAENPAMLAAQLMILLQGAIAEELRDPGIHAMENAAKAAHSIVIRSCQSGRRRLAVKWPVAGLAASILVGTLIWHAAPVLTDPLQNQATTPYATQSHVAMALPQGVNPTEIETALNLQEQFNRGVCPAPHLMALPPGQMTAYMNVIHFRAPENPEADRANLHAFLIWYEQARATECYYAPVNGHTLSKWRS